MGNSAGASVRPLTLKQCAQSIGSTCGGSAQDHRLSPGHTQVPDPITVAHVLLEQLAQSPGTCGGLETGHDLDRKRQGGPSGVCIVHFSTII